SLQEEQSHYEVSRGDIAREFCPVWLGGVLELMFITSQVEVDMLHSYALWTVFYNNFTTLLRDLYDSVGWSWYPLHRLSDTKRGVGIVMIPPPATVAVGKHNHIAQESRLDDTG